MANVIATQSEVGPEFILQDITSQPWCNYKVTVTQQDVTHTLISGHKKDVLKFLKDYLQLASLKEANTYLK